MTENEISYKIRGAIFNIYNKVGPGGYFGSICASVFGVVSASDSGPNCAII